MADGPDGLAVVDKEPGWTSHDVVAKLRGILGTRRIGHSGTLDPDATGVLLVGVGRMTRLLRFLDGLPKEYTAEVVLGTETDTLDASGDPVAHHDMGAITLDDVRRAVAERFVGEIEQVPPMVSAVKVAGRRLHELARAGVEVDRAPRTVTVHRFEVGEPVGQGVYPITVSCSSGTYVRVLAADLGTALGGGAHLRNLRRTAIGGFDAAQARPLEEVTAESLLEPAAALAHVPAVSVDSATAADVGHGKVLSADRLGTAGSGPWRVLDADGALLAVYEPHRPGTVKPAVVIAPHQ
jgi:tRNA pseudouridine55 synthase